MRLLTFILWIIATGLVLLDKTTPLEITNIKFYYCLLLISITLLASTILRFWLKLKGEILIMSITISTALLFSIAYAFTWRLEWKTETILYKNLHLQNRSIEFQRKDLGALGSISRTIDRIIMIPYFEWNKEISINKIDTVSWEIVDIEASKTC
ncbi:hypothetical protein [Marinifilum sp.]|uniref:hypothetical protein n=1 Tax=Marinifilum sp. TaxID=2033137 RepID=UPI003BA9C8F7